MATSAVATSASSTRGLPSGRRPPAGRRSRGRHPAGCLGRSAPSGLVAVRPSHRAAPPPTDPASSWRRNSSTRPQLVAGELDVAFGDQHLTVPGLHPQKAHRRIMSRPARRPDRARRRRRSSPTRTASAARSLAVRAACSGESPQASRAASTEEWVQPDPCAAPSGWRGPGISWSFSPSKKTSVAWSRWPPVMTTTLGSEGVDGPRQPLGLGRGRASRGGPAERAGAPRARFGVTTVDEREQPLDQRRARRGLEQLRTRLRDHHRVEHHRGSGAERLQRLGHRLDRGRRAEHPDLDRVDADVLRGPPAPGRG